MERLIDLFCHAIRISDPLSIKIAVGIIGGGLPLIFMVAAVPVVNFIRLASAAESDDPPRHAGSLLGNF